MEEFDKNKIKVIIGLGNIGKQYFKTRHNVGFDFVESLLPFLKFSENKALKSLIGKVKIGDRNVILCKPNTMMNMSGESVLKVLNYYKIEPEETLIVHDDLDLFLGTFKIQFAKGPKIHNGILSIEKRIGKKFWRLRIGVENRTFNRDNIIPADYVLSKFNHNESKIIESVFEKVIAILS